MSMETLSAEQTPWSFGSSRPGADEFAGYRFGSFHHLQHRGNGQIHMSRSLRQRLESIPAVEAFSIRALGHDLNARQRSGAVNLGSSLQGKPDKGRSNQALSARVFQRAPSERY